MSRREMPDREVPNAPVTNPQMIRGANRDLVLACLRRAGRASRAEIHRETGLTKPTVSKIVGELLREDLIREAGLMGSRSVGGRPSRSLELNATWAAYAGVELDTDRTRIAVADYTGKLRDVREGPPPSEDPRASLDEVVRLLRGALRRLRVPMARLSAVGVSVPSLIDPERGHCFLAPNLGWHDFPLADELSSRIKAPVHVANVPQAAALAESRWGAAQGTQKFVWVYVGSGVGAGIIENGRVFLGQRGLSGEFGHCRVVEHGNLCGCGKHGCLETVASIPAMLEHWRAQRLGAPGTASKRAQPARSFEALQQALRRGDESARLSLHWGAQHLGLGLSFLINMLDPQLVVIGGRAASLGSDYLSEVRRSTLEHSLAPERVNVLASTLGDDAALWGALLTGARRSTDPVIDISTLGHRGGSEGNEMMTQVADSPTLP